jgi:hypothetical protein
LGFEQVADLTERSPERVERSGLGLAQVRFDLSEGLFDRFAMMPLNACFRLTFSPMA